MTDVEQNVFLVLDVLYLLQSDQFSDLEDF